MRFSLPIKLRRPLYMTKIPFLRMAARYPFCRPHGTAPIKLSKITGALLHFKFVEDHFAGEGPRLENSTGMGRRICALPSEARGRSILELPPLEQRRT
jgi:hypothetical protein